MKLLVLIFIGIVIFSPVGQLIFGSIVSFLPGDVVARISDMVQGNYFRPFLLFVIFYVIYSFIKYFKKIRLLEKYDSTQAKRDLSRSDKITKNGMPINTSDFTAEFSVKKCPHCKEEVNIDAIKCRHCNEKIGKGYKIIENGTYVSNEILLEKKPNQDKKTLADLVLEYGPWVLGSYLLFSFLKWKYPYFFLELSLMNW